MFNNNQLQQINYEIQHFIGLTEVSKKKKKKK